MEFTRSSRPRRALDAAVTGPVSENGRSVNVGRPLISPIGTAQALALRARIVLRCAAGETHTAIAADLHVTKQTVGKWRHRFMATRVPGLLDEPRPGAPRTISDAAIERVLTTTLESTPRDATHWSTRSLAKQVGLTQTTIARI